MIEVYNKYYKNDFLIDEIVWILILFYSINYITWLFRVVLYNSTTFFIRLLFLDIRILDITLKSTLHETCV